MGNSQALWRRAGLHSFCSGDSLQRDSMSGASMGAQVEQNQRAFQKQDCIFVGKKKVLGKKAKGIRDTRYYKSVGLGIKTPRTAIEGTYVDKKCPWTGSVNIRGKLITGVIKTTKMKNTIIIRKDYLHYIKKYNRFEKRHKDTPVHVSPAFRVKQGDEILGGQCRPLSKTVRFNMLKVIRAAAGGDKKGFASF